MLAAPPKFASQVFNPEQFKEPTEEYQPLIRNIRSIPSPPSVFYLDTYAELNYVFIFGAYRGVVGAMTPFTIVLPPPTTPGYILCVLLQTNTAGTIATLQTPGMDACFYSTLTGSATTSSKTLSAGNYTFISTGSFWIPIPS